MEKNNVNTYIVKSVFGVVIRLLLPIGLVFLVLWQSVYHAQLNREIRKLSQKKEELFKKNYEIKAKIASTYAAERVESLHNNKSTSKYSYSKDRVITLTLPGEKSYLELDE